VIRLEPEKGKAFVLYKDIWEMGGEGLEKGFKNIHES
jgi:hypothetical protein